MNLLKNFIPSPNMKVEKCLSEVHDTSTKLQHPLDGVSSQGFGVGKGNTLYSADLSINSTKHSYTGLLTNYWATLGICTPF